MTLKLTPGVNFINILHKNIKKIQFWAFFDKYFCNSTYTRVDLYASIYDIKRIEL